MSFQNFSLHPSLLKVLEELGFTTPTPIQTQAIPAILQGEDLRASAQTGTGKTAAYLLPTMTKLTAPSSVESMGPRMLILVPTRELALQVSAEAMRYSKHLPRMKTVCIYGGMPYPVQNRQLSRPHEILVATPGRLIDHMERGRIDFSRLEILVLDEADRMLDMGFIDPVKQIASETPSTRQTLLFSATLKGPVVNLSKTLLNNPSEISIAPETMTHETIDQYLYYSDNLEHKNKLLEQLLIDETIQQAVIFTATKMHADHLVKSLKAIGHSAEALHGDMNQRQRTRTISKLRAGQFRLLVATDVAARGIDVPTISHVINFDLPNNVEDYVHRIGRTGRAGSSGIAFSFVSNKEFSNIKQIEQYMKKQITVKTIPGLEPKKAPTIKPEKPSARQPRNRFGKTNAPKGRFGRNAEAKSGRSKRESFNFSETKSERPARERFAKNEDMGNERPKREPSNFSETRSERPVRERFAKKEDMGSERPKRESFNSSEMRSERPARERFAKNEEMGNERPKRESSNSSETRSERPARERFAKKEDMGSERPRKKSFNSDMRSERPARERFSRSNERGSERPRRESFKPEMRSERSARGRFSQNDEMSSERPRREPFNPEMRSEKRFSKKDAGSERPRRPSFNSEMKTERRFAKSDNMGSERPRKSFFNSEMKSERPARERFAKKEGMGSERPKREFFNPSELRAGRQTKERFGKP